RNRLLPAPLPREGARDPGRMLRGWPQPLAAEGIEAIVFVTVNAKQTRWEGLLPAQCLEMPAELVAVDRLLDDPAFFEPYRAFFDPVWGRPSVPVETYLRLMFLKSRHGLSFESVVREAADSLSWRRFCRVPLGGKMPHPTL